MRHLILLLALIFVSLGAQAETVIEEAIRLAQAAAIQKKIPVKGISHTSSHTVNDNVSGKFLVSLDNGGSFEIEVAIKANNAEVKAPQLADLMTPKISFGAISTLLGSEAPNPSTVLKEAANLTEARIKAIAALKANIQNGGSPAGTYLNELIERHKAHISIQLERLKTVKIPGTGPGETTVVEVVPKGDQAWDAASLKDLASKLISAQLLAEQNAAERFRTLGTESLAVQLAALDAQVQRLPPGPALGETLEDVYSRVKEMQKLMETKNTPKAAESELEKMDQDIGKLKIIYLLANTLEKNVNGIKNGANLEIVLSNLAKVGQNIQGLGELGLRLPRLAQLVGLSGKIMQYAAQIEFAEDAKALRDLNDQVRIVEMSLIEMRNNLYLELEALKKREGQRSPGVEKSQEMEKLELEIKCFHEQIRRAGATGLKITGHPRYR